jgi:hypothetical protein
MTEIRLPVMIVAMINMCQHVVLLPATLVDLTNILECQKATSEYQVLLFEANGMKKFIQVYIITLITYDYIFQCSKIMG